MSQKYLNTHNLKRFAEDLVEESLRKFSSMSKHFFKPVLCSIALRSVN